MSRCIAPKSQKSKNEQCSHKALIGSKWCGYHNKKKLVFEKGKETDDTTIAVRKIQQLWRRWLALRAGPLLHFRSESNNTSDFFTADDVTEIPLSYFISFVDDGKGYCMDVRSIQQLFAFSKEKSIEAINPFNRKPFPHSLHVRLGKWRKEMVDVKPMEVSITDLFCCIDDLGFYSDPEWFQQLGEIQIKRLFFELAYYWGTMTTTMQRALCPSRKLFQVSSQNQNENETSIISQIRRILLKDGWSLITEAVDEEERKLGAMIFLGTLTLVSNAARNGIPWIYEQFSPGITSVKVNTQTGEAELILLIDN